MIQVSDATFEQQVLKSSLPVLVDFWAEWCGPCRALGPVLEEVAQELAGKVTIAKVNVDDNPQIPAQHNIRGIPTMILFKNGAAVSTQVGLMTKPKLVEWLQSYI